jgi:hypothetical protein
MMVCRYGIEIPEHKLRIRIVIFSLNNKENKEPMRNENNSNEINGRTMNKINE